MLYSTVLFQHYLTFRHKIRLFVMSHFSFCLKENEFLTSRPLPEQTVTVKYTTVLLTGDTVYSSDRDGLKRFKVDKSDEIAGLNEAVKMMRKGERARLVIPSFLAYGVAGDGDRIRGKVTLAMYVELIDIQ